jgi:hypothetical protein
MRDARTYEPLDAGGEGPRWTVRLTLAANDTVVLRVAGPAGLALDHLFLVRDRLRKAANYRDALRQAKTAAASPDYEALAKRVQTVQGVLATRDVQRPDVLAQLRPIAAALTIPSVQAATAETAWWGRRLADCTDAARREVLAAIGVLAGDPSPPR